MSDTERARIDTLGPALADPSDPDARGGKLARLGDLVCHLMGRDGAIELPLNDAACRAADILASAGDRVVFFRTKRAGIAQRFDSLPVSPVSGANTRRFQTRPVVMGSGWATNLDAPMPDVARGGMNPFDWSSSRKRSPAAQTTTTETSILERMRQEWGRKPFTTALLFSPRKLLSYIAIPTETAAELFGFGRAAALVAANPGPQYSSAGKVPADEDVLKELEILQASGQRKTTAALATKYGVAVDTIQRAAKRARGARLKTQTPPASVFQLGQAAAKKTAPRGTSRAR